MTEAVRLTVPTDRAYYGVVRLVVGGLAARLDLPYEQLEDVQLALEGLLGDEAYAADDAITVEVAVDDGTLELLVGPLAPERLDAELTTEADERRGVGLARLLTTVAGAFEVERRDGAEWIRIRKDVATRGVARR